MPVGEMSPVLQGQSVLPMSHILIPSVNMNVLKMMPRKFTKYTHFLWE